MTTTAIFSSTASGALGCHRETMLTNELLLRPELGKPRRRGYTCSYPGECFMFGKPNVDSDGGAPEALRGWCGLPRSNTLPFHHREKTADRDFMALNVAAVQNGLVTANEHYQFRATHDVRKKVSDEDKQKTKTRRLKPTMVFGISTRPSTPIFDLLEHKYQDRWLHQKRSADLSKRQLEQTTRKMPGMVYETRASLLRTYQNPVELAPLWQMPKFTRRSLPNLETFRSTKARETAYSAFNSDQISRKGTMGHGIYESAKD